MFRRAALAALFSCFAVLAAAIVPWTVSPDALRSSVTAPLRDAAGLELSAAGAATVAVLPVPRLTLESVALHSADGRTVVRGGTLRGELRMLPLLAGRLEFAELSLADAAIEVAVGDTPGDAWNQALAAVRARLDGAGTRGHVARLVLAATDLHLRDRQTGLDTVVHDINLAADWPTASVAVEAAGALTWRGEAIQFKVSGVRPDALAAGRTSPLKIDVSAPLAGLALTGELSARDDRRLVGRAAFTTRSLRDFSIWSGVSLPLGEAIGAFALDGDMRVDRHGVSWPAVRLTLGSNTVDGALSWRGDGERKTITSTLAADRLDLTGLAASLARLRTADGGWDADVFDLAAQSDADLDLRLSATTARIGPVRLDDMAANLSVKPGRYEIAINRASIGKGVAKGRAVLAPAGDGIEIKGQSSFERLDVAGLLADLGLARWASGSAQGQVTIEGAGASPAEIVRNLHGRAQMAVRQGELIGIGLADLLRRQDGKADTLPMAWLGGRTPFDQFSFQAAIADGVAAITDAKLSGTGVRAALQGRTSLAHRTLAAKASLDNGVASPGTPDGLVLDITGPWSHPTVVRGVPSLRPAADAPGPAAGQ